MEHSRTGEKQHIPFRSQRYFCINGAWYFQTRGGGQKGPFQTKDEMEAELLLFIREKTLEHNSISA
jgi:hypothetical protein